MSVSEASFGLRADEEHPAVLVEAALVHQVPHDRLGGLPERGEARPPLLPQPVPEALAWVPGVSLSPSQSDLRGVLPFPYKQAQETCA